MTHFEKCQRLEKKIKELEEQLAEANEIIVGYVDTTPRVPNDGWHIPNWNLQKAESYVYKRGLK